MKVLGLDIGGTTIKGAVCDGEEVLFQTKVPTNAQGGAPAILQAVFTLVDKLLPLTDEASPVGVGSAGDIDPYSGEVLYATENLPGFTGLPLRALISQYTGREVAVVNDAVAGLIGEMKFGGCKGQARRGDAYSGNRPWRWNCRRGQDSNRISVPWRANRPYPAAPGRQGVYLRQSGVRRAVCQRHRPVKNRG